jgi:hypothetical protein
MSESITSPKIAPSMACGQKTTVKGIEKQALAPLPITNNRQPIAITKFASVNRHGLLELRRVNTDIGIVKLMFFGRIFLIGMFVASWLMFSKMILIVLPMLILFTMPLVGILYFDHQDGIKTAKKHLPVIFHPQKRSLLISWARGGIIRPSLFGAFTSEGISKGASDGVILGAIAGVIFVSIGWILFIDDQKLTTIWMVVGIISLIIGIGLLYLPLKPWFTYFRQLRAQPPEEEQQLIGVPWEQVSVELHHLSAVSYIGLRTMFSLNFMCPLPGETDKKYLVSLPVYSREEGLSLFELIRDYMENGAHGIEHTAAAKLQSEEADYTRAAYRKKIEAMWQTRPLLTPFWRLWNILTLRYWAHWYLERDLDVLPGQMMNKAEIVEWCKPIPESEWQPMSEALKEANQRVRALYAAGHQWESPEVQAVLQEYGASA